MLVFRLALSAIVAAGLTVIFEMSTTFPAGWCGFSNGKFQMILSTVITYTFAGKAGNTPGWETHIGSERNLTLREAMQKGCFGRICQFRRRICELVRFVMHLPSRQVQKQMGTCPPSHPVRTDLAAFEREVRPLWEWTQAADQSQEIIRGGLVFGSQDSGELLDDCLQPGL